MKILDYIKNSRFEVTLQYMRKGEQLSCLYISKEVLENNKDKIEILDKRNSYHWEGYVECDIKITKNCYFIYWIDSYSDLDSTECELYYNRVSDIIEDK
nr:MAG TPA: hypothetical protein [Caudoviricetes sp.]